MSDHDPLLWGRVRPRQGIWSTMLAVVVLSAETTARTVSEEGDWSGLRKQVEPPGAPIGGGRAIPIHVKESRDSLYSCVTLRRRERWTSQFLIKVHQRVLRSFPTPINRRPGARRYDRLHTADDAQYDETQHGTPGCVRCHRAVGLRPFGGSRWGPLLADKLAGMHQSRHPGLQRLLVCQSATRHRSGHGAQVERGQQQGILLESE